MTSSKDSFLNLDQIVKDWAWRTYDVTATKKQKKLRDKEKKTEQKYLDVVLDWSEVRCRDETRWPRLQEETGKSKPEENQNTVQVAPSGDMSSNAADKELPAEYRPGLNVVFQTRYSNNTENDQEYTMKTEKTTRSSCSVEVERGFTHGVELSVALKTPCEIFEANAGYHREMSLTNTEGQTFEEELTWGVDSQITVKRNHCAEAQLVVNEKKYTGNFFIDTRISGYVYATFTNVRDNNSFVKMMGEDIVTILTDHVKKERRKGRALEFVDLDEKDFVRITTAGQCNFRFGINQEIIVHQKPL